MRKMWIVGGLLCMLFACVKNEVAVPEPAINLDKSPQLPDEPFSYSTIAFSPSFDTPSLNFFDSSPANNPITDEGATLGRVLFYDTNLSQDRSISCGSCHNQSHAFSDPRVQSLGVNDTPTPRNSMALVNIQFHGRLFWDARANSLESQVLQPIQDPGEMNMTLEEMLERIEELDYYPALFEAAFGQSDPTPTLVSRALAQFIRTMRSSSSRYDDGLLNDFIDFDSQEILGMEVFFGQNADCNSCHYTPNFMINSPINSGLDLEYSDQGQGAVTGNDSDNGQFRVPSLRNIEVTAPYMHDGRFATLEDVIEHYSSGIAAHPNLDDRLTTNGLLGGPPRQRNFSPEEKEALVAFLKTMTDINFLTNEVYSDPFP